MDEWLFPVVKVNGVCAMIGGNRVLLRGYGNVGNGCIFTRCDPGARVVLMILVVVHPMRQIAEIQKLFACIGAFGYKHSNVLSGLQHSRTHEYYGQPLVDEVDWTIDESGDASE